MNGFIVLIVVFLFFALIGGIVLWRGRGDSSSSLPNATPLPYNNEGRKSLHIEKDQQTPPQSLSSVAPGPQLGQPLDIVCVQGTPDGVVPTGLRVSFKRTWLTIGRGDGNDIVIPGRLVSRKHTVISVEENQLMIQDLDSTNGTWLNRQRVAYCPLSLGQAFQVGPCQFIVILSGSSIPTKASQTPLPSEAKENLTIVSHQNARAIAQQLKLKTEKLLGEGGAASVFLCVNTRGQRVALKILQEMIDPYFVDKFKDEIAIGSLLIHDQIVRVLAADHEHRHPYIMMEYMNGGSLRDYLNKKRVLSPAEAVQIVGQICLGLNFAHQHDIFHRDVKPENILYNTQGQFKVADFGIAKLTQAPSLTREGAIIGTPHYMSYEQAKADVVDGRSDQYSVATILFELLTGRTPFDGKGLTVIEHHLSTPAPSPRKFKPNIPAHLDQAILKALSKDRNQRFSSTLDFATAIGYKHQGVTLDGAKNYTTSLAGRLIAASNSPTRDIVALKKPFTDLGREMLQTNLPQISRKHARIFYIEGRDQYIIQDLGSANGTMINGRPLAGRQMLRHGDQVTLGGTISFVFRL